MEQKDRYTKKELATILSLKEEDINFYDRTFAIPGKGGMGILFWYSLNSAHFILKMEMQAQERKKTKTISREGSKIIQRKKSLEALARTAKLTGAPISANVGEPQYQGSDYSGIISYTAEPSQNLKFCFEQKYRIDANREVEEIIKNTRDELAGITEKHGVLTRYI